jgi:hypothetical protein
MIDEFKLAERVIELCPEVMGMNRVAQEVVRDPRVVSALVDRVEDYIRAVEEWEAHTQVLVDQRDWAYKKLDEEMQLRDEKWKRQI